MLIYTECAGSPHSWFSLTNHSILLLVFVVLGLNRALAHARKELHQPSHTPSFFFIMLFEIQSHYASQVDLELTNQAGFELLVLLPQLPV